MKWERNHEWDKLTRAASNKNKNQEEEYEWDDGKPEEEQTPEEYGKAEIRHGREITKGNQGMGQIISDCVKQKQKQEEKYE